MSLKERAMAPPGKHTKAVNNHEMFLKIKLISGPNAFAIGKGALVGGSALGIGALCFYGLGLGSGTNTLQNSQ